MGQSPTPKATRKAIANRARQSERVEALFKPNYQLEQELEDGWVCDDSVNYTSESSTGCSLPRVPLTRVRVFDRYTGQVISDEVILVDSPLTPPPAEPAARVDPASKEFPPGIQRGEFRCTNCFLLKNNAAVGAWATPTGPVCKDCQ